MSANTYLPNSPVIPGNLLITDITQDIQMQVTFDDSIENTYIPGQCVLLIIPVSYGMQQANGLTGVITAIASNVFTLNIDSTYFDPFIFPPIGNSQPASMSPAGSRNLQYSNQTNKVPFQALNGTTGN